ncbi:hypothetical protein [Cellulophaga lytica]|uniref:Uncharacterized protein n=1 Tax=Cellulophaga lytica (strain ATCC 23178 / DSM 7489 / JCM 8516 / NBRC 14961 / NCIMB 1423 / VKM B-1433 / Cy l20) TaxID=867900 RepID=F0RB05_CELLC|nr:hypothetical protein [Cellulophaga lytica]ADY30582.1 hypothetical protein Celly_2765 [Cellulophaga lytica DSM 7489]AIM61570.1 hypothetical protein IX49_13920 [Cellulophaga lytica]APU11462.1 hypothetical protein A5M85_14580 [Cellulophaga lytica]MDO6853168.1 hypothetical protein [Cellulophaga lytica]WQG78491.1 hypothetical protein SR888_06050 [Cellulophaga lytica]
MKKNTLSTLLLLCFTIVSFAQKKSDLIAQIQTLKDSISQTNIALAEANKVAKVSVAEADLYKNQATELQNANKSLLTNLKNFTQVSSQNSKNMARTLEALKAKESQLSIIEDSFSKNDSTAIVILTNAKQSLGENAKIAVTNGEVVITETEQNILDASKTKVSATGEAFLEKISKILELNIDSKLTITSTSSSLSALQNSLVSKFNVVTERISLESTTQNNNTVLFKIHTDYANFYLRVREHMKSIN